MKNKISAIIRKIKNAEKFIFQPIPHAIVLGVDAFVAPAFRVARGWRCFRFVDLDRRFLDPVGKQLAMLFESLAVSDRWRGYGFRGGRW